MQQLYDSRVAKPGDDIPSFLLGLRVGGETISRTQWVGLVMMLIMAGLDTTTNGAALMLHLLGTRPDIREQLTANPDGLPDAVEELLRWVSPVPHHSRGVTQACEVGGHQFSPGDVVLLHWLAANRDAEEFPEPDTFVAGSGDRTLPGAEPGHVTAARDFHAGQAREQPRLTELSR